MSDKANLQIGFDVAELTVIKLEPGDVLAVKLINDDFDLDTAQSLKAMLDQIFTKNKVMVFTMPNNSDIVFEAIKQPPTQAEETKNG